MAQNHQYFYLIRPFDMNEFDNPTVREIHNDYLLKLQESDKLLFSGYSIENNFIIVIFNDENRDSAFKTLGKNPLTKMFRATCELRSFHTSLIQKNYNSSLNHFMVFLYPPRPSFVNIMTDSEEKIMSAHFNYLQEALNTKKLVIAGPSLDVGSYGIIVLEGKNKAEIEQFMEKDPSIQARLTKTEIFAIICAPEA